MNPNEWMSFVVSINEQLMMPDLPVLWPVKQNRQLGATAARLKEQTSH